MNRLGGLPRATGARRGKGGCPPPLARAGHAQFTPGSISGKMKRRGYAGAWLALGFAGMLWLAALGRDGLDGWINATVLPDLVPETSVEVLARDDTLLRAFGVADGRWRLATVPGQVDAGYLAMLIAYEDRRFFEHRGVDLRAAMRAAWQGLSSGRIVSGGSTLTMQVARLLEQGSTGQWRGKLRQVRLALALERHLDKQQILALYLHLAPYGGNLEGVRAASFAWFGKEPARLTPAQAALLVALPQAPEARRPDRHPERAEAARNLVLARMQAAGVIAPDTASAALREPVPRTRRPFPALAPHLAERLRLARPDVLRHHTTLDPLLQAQAERLARDAVAGLGPEVAAALVLADHQSGAILAHVGSPDFTDDRRQGFNDMTRALRSPGSTLKPLVYALAFGDGLALPGTMIEDRPESFAGYRPGNFDGRFRGVVTAREALQLSLNLPVVALTEALGPARLMAGLRGAGVQAEVPGGNAGLAVALGGVGTTLEGLVQLYAALARGGDALALSADAEVPPARLGRIVPAEAAWHVGQVLSGMPPTGMATGVLAWKTGTSYGYRDALAIGYDGQHVAGVWMGRADGTPVPGRFGADQAAPVLFELFARAAPRRTPLPPPPPGTLILGTADLPPPLRDFRPHGADPAARDAPQLAFPPDGAIVETGGTALFLRVERGTAPFTWLANGVPVLGATLEREALLEIGPPGFHTIAVIDAEGRAARAAIELR